VAELGWGIGDRWGREYLCYNDCQSNELRIRSVSTSTSHLICAICLPRRRRYLLLGMTR
jgi:hypothetical protein